MIFRPFYEITKENPIAVYDFLCKYFYENNIALTTEENEFINKTLTSLEGKEIEDFNSFLEPFKNEKRLYKGLIKMRPNERFDCFVNNKRVYISTLDGTTLALTIAYLNIFGYSNVQN